MQTQFSKTKKVILIGAVFLIAASCNPFGGNGGVLGVLKTLDGGGTWQPQDSIVNSKSNISSLTVAEMAFDPNNRQNIYLAAANSGLWISKDSAGTWQQILSKVFAYDFYVDPSNTNTIYVAGIFNDHGRVVRTKDAGKTWEEEYIEGSIGNSVNTITANPGNSQELYAGLNSGVLIKSTDGGANWFVIHDFGNNAINILNGGNVSLNSADQILRARYDKLNNALYVLLRNNGVARSTDGGQNWTFITAALTKENLSDLVTLSPRKVSSFNKMALDDLQVGVLYLTTSNGLYKSVDNGANWLFLNVPITRKDQLPKAVASTKGGMLAYTSIGNTIFKTLDGGQSWQTQELPTTNLVNKILIDPQLPQITYAGLIAAP